MEDLDKGRQAGDRGPGTSDHFIIPNVAPLCCSCSRGGARPARDSRDSVPSALGFSVICVCNSIAIASPLLFSASHLRKHPRSIPTPRGSRRADHCTAISHSLHLPTLLSLSSSSTATPLASSALPIRQVLSRPSSALLPCGFSCRGHGVDVPVM
jgi:hypothetical protein